MTAPLLDELEAFPLDNLGSCRACDPALFWYRDSEEQAKQVCAGCPVLDACRTWALATPVGGVVGGMTEAERDRARGRAMPFFAGEVDDEEIGTEIAACVAAGMTDQEIALHLGVSKRTARRYRPVQPKVLRPCGTDAAYFRHRKHGEDPCLPCRAAHAEEERQRQARHREQLRRVREAAGRVAA